MTDYVQFDDRPQPETSLRLPDENYGVFIPAPLVAMISESTFPFIPLATPALLASKREHSVDANGRLRRIAGAQGNRIWVDERTAGSIYYLTVIAHAYIQTHRYPYRSIDPLNKLQDALMVALNMDPFGSSDPECLQAVAAFDAAAYKREHDKHVYVPKPIAEQVLATLQQVPGPDAAALVTRLREAIGAEKYKRQVAIHTEKEGVAMLTAVRLVAKRFSGPNHKRLVGELERATIDILKRDFDLAC
jgi:hypothetical protein